MKNMGPDEHVSPKGANAPSPAAISRAADLLNIALERIARERAEAAYRAELESDDPIRPDEPVTG